MSGRYLEVSGILRDKGETLVLILIFAPLAIEVNEIYT